MVFLQKTEIASQKWMIFLFFRILFLLSGNNKLDQLDGIPEKVDVIPQIMDHSYQRGIEKPDKTGMQDNDYIPL